MEKRIIVSGGGKLRAFDAQHLSLLGEVPLGGSGALCAGEGCVFCACDDDSAVYRVDPLTLLPQSVYTGGPQMRTICLSRDKSRLYILCSGADSVLMLSAYDGAPMMLARVGVNPQSLRLDDTGERLVIAGGRDGCVHLLCAGTLSALFCLRGEGFCADAILRRGKIRALRLGGKETFASPGRVIHIPGGALIVDSASERLFSFGREGGRVVCEGARDAVLAPG